MIIEKRIETNYVEKMKSDKWCFKWLYREGRLKLVNSIRRILVYWPSLDYNLKGMSEKI
jgi:hypothetical protein